MLKITLILIFILIARPGYKVMPVLAEETALTTVSPEQQEKDLAEIKGIVDVFIQCSVRGDIECLMSHVSENLSVSAEGKTLDYNEFKARLEYIFKNSVDRSFDNLKIIESNVSEDKATILVEYHAKAFDLVKSMDSEVTRKVQYSFAKEGGSWRIVGILTIS